MENWKDVAGYEGRYQVSNCGRVKNIRTGRVLRPAKNSRGYLRVLLCKDNEKKNRSVHRLVALAFVPSEREGLEVNHKNGVKTDNRAENLEWVTRSENMVHLAAMKAARSDELRKLVTDAVAEAMLEEDERLRAMEAKLQAIEERARELGVRL